LTTRLFVYGTLAPGHSAWSVLEPWVVGEPRTDAVAGCLYDTGRGYPGATFRADERALPASTVVHGSVVEIDPERRAAALTALDRYEGAEYERVAVRTEAGVEATAYAWIAPLTGCHVVSRGRWVD
jgi:gamma-glutamylcyclotransferase (GGCT)/AIG2-like uncharacterized protein YtfP